MFQLNRALVFVISIVFLFGCAAIPHTLDNSKKWLPADFDPRNTVLIIETIKWPKRQQRVLDKFMKKKYPYKYIFVEHHEFIGNENYEDSVAYKFEILGSESWHGPTSNTTALGYPNHMSSTIFDYYFYDRTTDKTYPLTNRGSAFASIPIKDMILTILKKFNHN